MSGLPCGTFVVDLAGAFGICKTCGNPKAKCMTGSPAAIDTPEKRRLSTEGKGLLAAAIKTPEKAEKAEKADEKVDEKADEGEKAEEGEKAKEAAAPPAKEAAADAAPVVTPAKASPAKKSGGGGGVAARAAAFGGGGGGGGGGGEGKQAEIDANQLAKFDALVAKSTDEQAEFFLKSFIFALGDGWKDVMALAKSFSQHLDSKNQDKDLDCVQAADFLQHNGRTRTAMQRRAELRDVDLDNNDRICFLEYLLIHYKVSGGAGGGHEVTRSLCLTRWLSAVVVAARACRAPTGWGTGRPS